MSSAFSVIEEKLKRLPSAGLQDNRFKIHIRHDQMVKLNFTTEDTDKSNCPETSQQFALHFGGGIMFIDKVTRDSSIQAVDLAHKSSIEPKLCVLCVLCS